MRHGLMLVLCLSGCFVPRTLGEVHSHVSREDFSSAQAVLDAGLAKKPGHAKLVQGQQFLDALNQAQDALQRGQTSAALALYKRADVLQPGQYYVSAQRSHTRAILDAEMAIAAEDWIRAQKHLAQAERARPQSAQVPVYRAQLHTVQRAADMLDREDYNGASNQYASVRAFPLAHFAKTQQHLIVELRAVVASLDQERWQDAHAAVARANTIKPSRWVERFDTHATSMIAADEAIRTMRWEDAVGALKQAESSRPGQRYVPARQALAVPMAQAHRRMAAGKYNEAVAQLNLAQKVAPNLSEIRTWTRYAQAMHEGTLADQDHAWRRAEQRYLAALRVRPQNTVASQRIAFVRLMAQGDGDLKRLRWADASKAYGDALAIRGKHAYATRQRTFCSLVVDGLSHEQAGAWKASLAAFQKADEAVPGHPFVVKRMLAVQGAAVRGALDKAVAQGREGRFETAFRELGFAANNGAALDQLDRARSDIAANLRRSLDTRVQRANVPGGYALASLGLRELGEGVRWLHDAMVRLRTIQLEAGWALVGRGEYEAGMGSLDIIERFEPQQKGFVQDERLRMRMAWAEDVTAQGMRTGEYGPAIDQLHHVLDPVPALRRERDQLEGDLRTAWATVVRNDALNFQRARKPGAAAAAYARAVEIAGRAEDQAALTGILNRLRDRGMFHVKLEMYGEAKRTEPVRLQLNDAVRGMAGVSMAERRLGPHLTLVVDATQQACSTVDAVSLVHIKDPAGTVVHSYESKEVTRTCEASVAVSFKQDGRSHKKLVQGSTSVSDVTHGGAPAHGVEADPLQLGKDDDRLVSDVDVSLAATLRDTVAKGVTRAWRQRIAAQIDRAQNDPDGAVGSLIGMWHAERSMFTPGQARALELLLRQRYGLQDPGRILN